MKIGIRSTLALVALAAGITLAAFTARAELYQYKDSQGITHYVESINQVPEQYRNQIKGISGDTIPTIPSAPQGGIKKAPVATGQTATDDQGRGEAYWCGRKKTLDAKIADLEAEEKKLEATGPFNLDREQGQKALNVLHADIQSVKEELESARKERDGLSEEARKAGAQPGWLRESCADGVTAQAPEERRRDLKQKIAEEEKKIVPTDGNDDPILAGRNAEIRESIERMKAELESLGQSGGGPSGRPPSGPGAPTPPRGR